MHDNEHTPGTPAPLTASYEELNVLGSPTGRLIEVHRGDLLPVLPRGWMWRSLGQQSIATMSAADLRTRADQYRQMASTATTAEVRDGLLRLAKRFMDLADQRNRG